MEKACSKCGEIKPLGEFHKHKSQKDGHCRECKECTCARGREWYAANKGQKAAKGKAYYAANKKRIAAKGKAYYAANVERYTDRWLQKTYSVSLSEYNEMLGAQDNRCAICGEASGEFIRKLAVDHDHETGQIRGLLCGRCNPGLGYFMHDPELLKQAIGYLEYWAEVVTLGGR